MKQLLHWLPRILSVLFIAFISLFALDVFDQPQWFMALIIHLTPSFVLIAVTAIAWRNRLVGGLLFLVAGFFLSNFESLIVSAPAFVIGALFLFSHYYLPKI
jgi:hypothetical protein